MTFPLWKVPVDGIYLRSERRIYTVQYLRSHKVGGRSVRESLVPDMKHVQRTLKTKLCLATVLTSGDVKTSNVKMSNFKTNNS